MTTNKITTIIRIYIPIVLTWLTIIGLPIGIGLVIRRLFPTGANAISWVVGILAFVACLACGEWLLRGLKTILLPDEQSNSASTTPEQRIATIIGEVLTQQAIRYSKVAPKLNIVSSNPLCNEAIKILESCADASNDIFDQAKIRQHWSQLVHLMNVLRTI